MGSPPPAAPASAFPNLGGFAQHFTRLMHVQHHTKPKPRSLSKRKYRFSIRYELQEATHPLLQFVHVLRSGQSHTATFSGQERHPCSSPCSSPRLRAGAGQGGDLSCLPAAAAPTSSHADRGRPCRREARAETADTACFNCISNR